MTGPLRLAADLFVMPTPAGAFHVVTSTSDDPAERLIRSILRSDHPVQLTDVDLCSWTGVRSGPDALGVVADAQAAGWVEGRTDPPVVPDSPLGSALPELLAPLSATGHAALVDDQGFGLASVGFTADAETDLSALSAEIARLRQRRRTSDGSRGSAAVHAAGDGWAVVDRHGASTIAFYPIRAGTQQFVLVLGGAPRVNHPSFVTLIWALSMRYDATPDHHSSDHHPTDPTHPAAAPATALPGGSPHA